MRFPAATPGRGNCLTTTAFAAKPYGATTARKQLRAAGLAVVAPYGFAANAVVVKQFPRPGVAAGKRMRAKLLLRAAPG